MALLLVVISTSFSVLILVSSTLIPYFVLNNDVLRRKRLILPSGALSLCNCFAAGVFLATCFLGLIPHTRIIQSQIHNRLLSSHDHFQEDGPKESDEHYHSWVEIIFDVNLMILVGFLLTLFIEQIVDFHQSSNIHKDAAHKTCNLSARSCHKQISTNSDMTGNRKIRQIVPRSSSINDTAGGNGDVVEPLVVQSPSFLDDDSDENETIFQHIDESSASGGGSGALNNCELQIASPLSAVGSVAVDEAVDLERSSAKLASQYTSKSSTVMYKNLDKHQGKSRNHRNRNDNGINTNSGMRSFFLLLAMSVHSFFEGIALGSQEKNFGRFIRLLVSIMLHEVLCAFAYGISLSRQRSRVSTFWAVFSSLILASSIPLGMLLMAALGAFEGNIASLIVRFVLEALSSGIFIYVACMEMLAHEFSPHSHSHNEPSDEDHHHHGDPLKAVVVLLGAAVAFVVNNFVGH